MAMKIEDIEERLLLARAAARAAFQNRDIDEVIRRKEEMRASQSIARGFEAGEGETRRPPARAQAA